MPQQPGTLVLHNGTELFLEIGHEQYRILLEEAERLLLQRRAIPILKVHTIPGSQEPPALSIEGHAVLNGAGKAVLLFTRAGHYVLPLFSFQKVVNKEVVSAVLLPFIPEVPL
ncbi:MAG TPA: hypothetical protein VE134_04860 [Methanomicrobiales archaeon]|nr:hypothetical protein [Methanomicrobiales archaeon]